MVRRIVILIAALFVLVRIGFAAEIEPVTKIIPSFTFQNAKEVAVLADGRKIVHAIIQKHHTQQMQVCSIPKIDMTKESFDGIGLIQFIGFTEDDVTTTFSELAGTAKIGVDEKGKDILVPKLLKHRWTSQDHGAIVGYFVVASSDHSRFKAVIKSTKDVDIETIKLKPEYLDVKLWVDNLIAEKEIELKEVIIIKE